MKKKYFLFGLIFFLYQISYSQSWIRINQLGYEYDAHKVAVLISKEKINVKSFEIVDAITNKSIYKSNKVISTGKWYQFLSTYRLNFTNFKTRGLYYIKVDKTISPVFRIDNGIYNNTPDFLLKYIRQQRCGYNPFYQDSCHTHDGFVVYNSEKEGERIDVVGGWHDASDYLRYVATSATTTFQLLFAYYKNPHAFGDYFDKDGNLNSDKIPDVLNEAKWGIDWLLKMNPAPNEMYNQIADDRDHRGFRLPTQDTVSYGKGLERPVYFVTGEPQGLLNYKNRTTGVSSTASKFASVFGLAGMVLEKLDCQLSEKLFKKAFEAYQFSNSKPGYCQTAPCRAPYFYEEQNYYDDNELAAVILSQIFNDSSLLKEAIEFGRKEPITPWIGKDTARHYQWYPFVNLGHYFIAKFGNKNDSEEFIDYLKRGLELIEKKSHTNPFRIGVPFIWCSNNLIASILTQFRLYHELTRDARFLELEAAHRDWLFGCNVWGTSMVVGLPEWGDYPEDIHAAATVLSKLRLDGALVDGPVYASIFNNLIGIKLYSPDEYEEFQTDYIVYHDDWGDYSTNEPTLDGTASLLMYLSFLHNEKVRDQYKNSTVINGGIVRFDSTEKKIFLIFSGHEFGDGFSHIIQTLKNYNIKASFFFTGDFLRNQKFKPDIIKIIKDGHYLGPHSDKHLLYCDWSNRDSILIDYSTFSNDLRDNLLELAKFGIKPHSIKYFLPPFEWYNQKISEWAKSYGLKIISFTPRTFTNSDYTTPDMINYLSSDEIIQKLFEYESKSPNGLNGSILLIHVGTDPKREDRLYLRLDEIITILKSNGYNFDRLD